MHPKSSSSPAKPAIDRAFYEHLNELKQRRSPLNQPRQLPDAPAPALVPGFFRQSPLPCLKDAAAVLASSEPKLVLIPKRDKHHISNIIVEQDASPCHPNTGPASRAQVTPLALSGSGRSGKTAKADQSRSLSPSQSPSPRSGNTKSDNKSDNPSRRSSPRVSPAPSPAPSPRGLPDAKSSGISVSSASTSATSSAESSPATTPRGEAVKERLSGVRKLQRKLTQKAEELAATVGEVFKAYGSRSRAGSGDRSSPQTPESPRVRFGSVDLVDMDVALDDSRFDAFVADAANAAFLKPWEKDTSDVTDIDGNRKKNADKLKPTFIRDFDNSFYYCRDQAGQLIRLKNTDEFIAYIGEGQVRNFAGIVSNIASQNLGNFLKNALFLRHDAQKKSQSILRLGNGTPIMPLAVARASYMLSKSTDGRLTIDYCWDSNAAVNGNKPMRAKTLDDQAVSFEVSNHAKLKVSVRVTIAPDGDWEIANPRVQASGWSMTEAS